MQQILNFVIRNKTFLLFLFLFSLAIVLTIQSHSYHRSTFINSANNVTGGIYSAINSVDSYFDLRTQNRILSEENKTLRALIFNKKSNNNSVATPALNLDNRYKVRLAEVYKNSYNAPNNILTINKGQKDSIKEDYAVITSKGIVGIVDYTSNNYANVLSILSKKSRINAKIKHSNHIGSLIWNTISPEYVQLVDVSKFSRVKKGDTIETGGQSAIFPKGIGIGTVSDFKIDISGDTYIIEVKLFNDMTNIGTVYIIEDRDNPEIKALEQYSNE